MNRTPLILAIASLVCVLGFAPQEQSTDNVASFPSRPAATPSFDPGPAISDCGHCRFTDVRIVKSEHVLDTYCPQSDPYRKETFRCEKWDCTNGTAWARVHVGWDWFCSRDAIWNPCPSSTCRMQGIGQAD